MINLAGLVNAMNGWVFDPATRERKLIRDNRVIASVSEDIAANPEAMSIIFRALINGDANA